MMRTLALAAVLVAAALPAVHGQAAKTAAPAGSTLVIDTAKGTIEIRLDRAGAPKSVAHIESLVKNNFYRGQRIHRVESSLVQFGDPASRDVSRQASWGTGNSGSPIGVAEITARMKHVRGAVGLAHSGDAKYADSQIYIMKTASPGLDGKHAIIGQVTKGMDVVDRLEVADVLKLVSIR